MKGTLRTRRGLARIPPRYWGALALYLLIGATFVHDWDGYVFEQSVRDFWDGYSPYTVAQKAPFYTFLNDPDPHPQWYAYPPLPLLAMSVTFLPEHFLDVPPFVERLLIKLPVLAGTLALAAIGGAWVRRLGRDERTRVRVERILLFNPFILIVAPVWGMTDPALVALFLAGALRFSQGHPYQAGLLFSLSALVKPFPVLIALPLAAYYVHTSGWKSIARLLTTAVPTAAAVCLPFILTNPNSFWAQVVGVHLRREPQGLTLWSVGPLADLGHETIGLASITLLSGSLLLLSLLAPRLQDRTAPLVLLLATTVQVLLWNRVVNEQYLILVVTPLLLLGGLGILQDRLGRATFRYIPLLFSAITVFEGYHFLTFLPPDVALPLFRRPVDVVAWEVQQHFNWGLENPFPAYTPAVFVSLALLVVAFVSFRYLAQAVPRIFPESWMRHRSPTASSGLSAVGCVVVLLLGFTPLVSPTSFDSSLDVAPLEPREPYVGAFYYLWWHNAAHDPGTKYGNWLEASQSPELGYYTQTRGVARVHAQMMRENGVDVAIVSYHSSEFVRYKTFQEEAARQGLLVAPLIELNQVYDQLSNKPLNVTKEGELKPADYAAYKLGNGTREAIESFVLELAPTLRGPNAYRIEGRPVVFFYDSYVSAIGFGREEKLALSQALLDTRSPQDLRSYFSDPNVLRTYYATPHARLAYHRNEAYLRAHYESSAALFDLLDSLYVLQGELDKQEERLTELAASPNGTDAPEEAELRDLVDSLRKSVRQVEQSSNNRLVDYLRGLIQAYFTMPALAPRTLELLTDWFYPSSYKATDQPAYWRQAHLEFHKTFWNEIRSNLERETGPLFLVSGDAFNEDAGYTAGTVKSLVDLEVFDGAFIYSPSFTWGVQPRKATFEGNFTLWEDRNLWLTAFGSGMGRFSAFGVAPSYDDTVKRGPNGFVIPAVHNDRFTYDRSWESALRNPPSLVILATFNEFFEGSSVEPDLQFGNRFLNQTREYREHLVDRQQELQTHADQVVTLVHEHMSRTNPNPRYSEQDDPHWWGLGLVAASGRVFAGSQAIVALDGQEDLLVSPPRPRLLLIDGGRDDYDNSSLSQPILEQVRAWVRAGLPTIVLGREVAQPLRYLLSEECRKNPTVPLGRYVPGEDLPGEDDQLNQGDRLHVGARDESEVRDLLLLEREGETHVVGHRCADHPNLAFTIIKPWGPTEPWGPPAPSDPACLEVVIRTFFPETLERPGPNECVAVSTD